MDDMISTVLYMENIIIEVTKIYLSTTGQKPSE